MAEKKAHEVDNWLKKPDPAMRIVLVYGPDRGLVSERALAFAQSTGLPLDDPFAVTRLEGSEVEKQPGRLTEEVASIPMFSEKRLIWVRGIGAGTGMAAEVAELARTTPADAVVLLEAGELKKGTGLRAAVEKAGGAMALPSYADEGKGIEGLIDEMCAREKLTIEPEARQALRALLGGDRLATRGELSKLALYSAGNDRIGLADVEAAIGDVSARSQEDMLDAVLAGEAGTFDTIFSSLMAGGANAGVVLSAALRRFQMLETLKAEMDATGKPAQVVIASARPPIFFARRRAFEAAIGRWPADALAAAVTRLDAAVLQTRRNAGLAVATARQSLLALTLEARRQARRR
ncbi:DNA polymerase III subunit delta [Chelativorans sp. ZYF759]|uniref:DNA polymerase III subunit delta n=1 Tax=Chelativorans sp. ZYF759 TaxID=2692213 RepID=UPI00145EAC6D|nr:DNA polymerase III subunit delta [Chelativorans sp. ZYF759]NMG38179.1 DNA polymerase III subunit delta [Chelativorans sp. ZYF759]